MKYLVVLMYVLLHTPLLKAADLKLPEGKFIFQEAYTVSTKHVVLLNLNVDKEKERYEKLKMRNYRCSRASKYLTKCLKFIDMSYTPENINLYKSMELEFKKVKQIEVINEGGTVSKYAITQTVSNAKSEEVEGYLLYLTEENKKMADFNFLQSKSRYQFLNKNEIEKLHIEKEKVSSKETKSHYVYLKYSKDSV